RVCDPALNGHRPQRHGCLARNAPALIRLQRRSAAAAVTDIFAGPLDLPTRSLGRSHQRLCNGIKSEVTAKIHDQETITAVLREVSEDKGLWPQDRSIHAVQPLSAKRRIVAP